MATCGQFLCGRDAPPARPHAANRLVCVGAAKTLISQMRKTAKRHCRAAGQSVLLKAGQHHGRQLREA